MKTAGKLMAKSRSQPVNLPDARPLMNPLLGQEHHFHTLSMLIYCTTQHKKYWVPACLKFPPKFACFVKILKYFFYLVGKWLAWQSEYESLLAQSLQHQFNCRLTWIVTCPTGKSILAVKLRTKPSISISNKCCFMNFSLIITHF